MDREPIRIRRDDFSTAAKAALQEANRVAQQSIDVEYHTLFAGQSPKESILVKEAADDEVKIRGFAIVVARADLAERYPDAPDRDVQAAAERVVALTMDNISAPQQPKL